MTIQLNGAQVKAVAALGRRLRPSVLAELTEVLPVDVLADAVRRLNDDVLAPLVLDRVLAQMTAQIGPTSDKPSDPGINDEAVYDCMAPVETPECLLVEQRPDSKKPPIQRLVHVERRKVGRPVKYQPDSSLEDRIVDYAASQRGCIRKEIAFALGVPLNYSFDKAMARVLQDGRMEKRGERGLTSYHAEKRVA